MRKAAVTALVPALALILAVMVAAQGNPKDGVENGGTPLNRPTGFSLPGETCIGNGGNNCTGLIPDSGTSGTYTSSFTISSCSSNVIQDVNVGVDLIHTFVADLDISITGPGAGPFLLQQDVCGSEDDEQAVLDDEGLDGTIGDVCPIVGGSFVPDPDLLAGFDGTAGDGTWTLDIVDDAGGDVGQMVNWSVEVTCAAPVPAMPPYWLLGMLVVLVVGTTVLVIRFQSGY